MSPTVLVKCISFNVHAHVAWRRWSHVSLKHHFCSISWLHVDIARRFSFSAFYFPSDAVLSEMVCVHMVIYLLLLSIWEGLLMSFIIKI